MKTEIKKIWAEAEKQGATYLCRECAKNKEWFFPGDGVFTISLKKCPVCKNHGSVAHITDWVGIPLD